MPLSFSWTEYADGRIFVAQPDQEPREAIGHEAEILRKLRDLNVELEAANGISALRMDDAMEFKRERDEAIALVERLGEALSYDGPEQRIKDLEAFHEWQFNRRSGS